MSRHPFGAIAAVPGAVIHATPSDRLVFLRKVYGLFFLGLGVAGVGGYVGMQAAATIAQNPIAVLIGYVVTVMVCYWQRKVFPLNILLFGLFTFVSGLTFGPLLALYVLGGDAAILGHALGITGCIFGGLTAYTLSSKSDFSFLGGALSIGLFAAIGFSIFGFLLGGIGGGTYFYFSVGMVVLFSGFVLYDTSRIMHHYRTDEYVAGALSLYLDFIILFRYVLALLSRGDD